MKKYDKIKNLSFEERMDILRIAVEILWDYDYSMMASDLEEIIDDEVEEHNDDRIFKT